MLVDDDPDIRKIGRLSLAGVGRWDVCLASSGKEALQIAPAERPDVILLDISMPDMDGMQTLSKLKELPGAQSIPVIMTSSRVDEVIMDECVSQGAIGVLTKPFNPTTLPNDIQHLLANG